VERRVNAALLAHMAHAIADFHHAVQACIVARKLGEEFADGKRLDVAFLLSGFRGALALAGSHDCISYAAEYLTSSYLRQGDNPDLKLFKNSSVLWRPVANVLCNLLARLFSRRNSAAIRNQFQRCAFEKQSTCATCR
jgi:hypothetical protein